MSNDELDNAHLRELLSVERAINAHLKIKLMDIATVAEACIGFIDQWVKTPEVNAAAKSLVEDLKRITHD